MNNTNPIHKDITKTIDDLLLSLPFKKGDLVRTFYTNPPSTRKIEELQICSAFPSGVRVQLENVKTAGGTELWLDSGWIAAPIKVEEPEPALAPYKVGDLVRFFQNKSPHYPEDLVVERMFPTREGTRVKFVGVDDPADPDFIHPIKEETKAESKAMTDIKWIPIDPENLPEGEVLAISDRGVVYLSSFKLVTGVPVIKEEKSPTFVVGAAYIPLDHLKQLWAEQNPASRYSKDSQAYEVLLWHMKDGVLREPWNSALLDCPLEAANIINFLADSMFLNYFHSVAELIIANTQIKDELVFWMKDYIANN
jgi:hypothetical protein